MNEFYSPNRDDDNVQTSYAEPADEIKIVVDDSDNGARFCSRCGNPLESGDAFCSKCGAQTYGDAAGQTQTGAHTSSYTSRTAQHTQSPHAGQPNVVYNYNYNYNNNVNSGNTNVNMNGKVKNKYVSLLLCLFLGVLGAHRFYEGKIATGILWACTGGLFGIGWFIDLLILIFKPRWYNP